MIISVTKNLRGRDFVIGDLHGCYAVLQKLLAAVNFDTSQDRLFALGDLGDRGDESLVCLDLLKQPWFFSVRGNHEEMMLGWFKAQEDERADLQQNWLREGGAWFFTLSPGLKNQYCRQVELLPYVMLIRCLGSNYCLLHAEIAPEIFNLDDFLLRLMQAEPEVINACLRGRRRQRSHFEQKVTGVDYVVSGHTPVRPEHICAANTLRMNFGVGHCGKLSGLGILQPGTIMLTHCYRYRSKGPGMPGPQ